MPDLCMFCPDYVIDTIAARVARDVNRIERIIYLTSQFARPLEDLADQVSDDLDGLLSVVPPLPQIDFSDVAGLIEIFLCPLTPLAMLEDPTLLNDRDPNLAHIKISRMVRFQVDRVVAQYEARIQSLRSIDIVAMYRRYIKELYRILDNPIEFVKSFARSVGYILVVRTICPDVYDDRSYPFRRLEDLRGAWSFDGFLPSGLPTKAARVAMKLAKPEALLMQWRNLTVTML